MTNGHLTGLFCPAVTLSKTGALKLIRAMLCTLTLASASTAPAFCQGFSFQGSVNITPPGLPAPPNLPGLPGLPGLPQLPGMPGITVSSSGGGNGNLPPCNLDSFVYQAGGQAESIYGDEGVGGKSPYASFTTASRINSGITGYNDAGLTTGHGSYMPDAWGGDEWTGNEWGPSGAGSGAASMGMSPPMNDDGDQTQTKEAGNSAAGSGGFPGLLTVPTNGDLSLVWNPPAPTSSGITGGTGGDSGSGGLGFSIPGLNIGFGSSGVSVGVSIPGL